MNKFRPACMRQQLWIAALICVSVALSPLAAAPPAASDNPRIGQVAPVPNPAQWEITILWHPEFKGQVSARTPTEINCIRYGNIRRDAATYATGKSTESWLYEKYFIDQDPVTLGIYVSPRSGDEPDPANWLSLKNGSLRWVSRQTFVKEAKQKDKTCYYYESVSSDGTTLKVWIEKNTLRPAAFDDGRRTYEFNYLSAPPQAPVLPKAFANEREHVERAQNKFN